MVALVSLNVNAYSWITFLLCGYSFNLKDFSAKNKEGLSSNLQPQYEHRYKLSNRQPSLWKTRWRILSRKMWLLVRLRLWVVDFPLGSTEGKEMLRR